MTDGEIIKLLEILIGSTEAIGDSAVDKKVKKNLMMLIDITNWCIDGIVQASKTRHRPEYSMREIGECAFSAMCEFKEWLQERIEAD